ncbi:hypothetical protein TcCL_NonESM00042 [Trypanosoma cruzi]|nr:hypothetical protein TcCL_NonESM00042 [Trypanosoma cruzi]
MSRGHAIHRLRKPAVFSSTTEKALSIRLLLWTKRPRSFTFPSTIARQPLESSVSLSPGVKEDGGKGDRPTSPQTCMRLSKVFGFNRLLIHSKFNAEALTRCSATACSSCGVASRVLVARLVILAAWL